MFAQTTVQIVHAQNSQDEKIAQAEGDTASKGENHNDRIGENGFEMEVETSTDKGSEGNEKRVEEEGLGFKMEEETDNGSEDSPNNEKRVEEEVHGQRLSGPVFVSTSFERNNKGKDKQDTAEKIHEESHVKKAKAVHDIIDSYELANFEQVFNIGNLRSKQHFERK